MTDSVSHLSQGVSEWTNCPLTWPRSVGKKVRTVVRALCEPLLSEIAVRLSVKYINAGQSDPPERVG